MENMNLKAIDYYVYNYPQLTLGVRNGLKETEEYKDIVLRGNMPKELVLPIDVNSEAQRIEVNTPIGKTEVLYLEDRDVFEYFVKVLAYKCEDVSIPKTTGAIFISGLNNWRKIEEHQNEYLKDHTEEEWDEEFDRFVSNKENYKGQVLLISKGYYSATPPSVVEFDEDTWIKLSKEIRIYHEITHQISRKLYPSHKEAIRDEVIADAIGIIGALGLYDKTLHQKVLGIIDGEYIKGSRLENYIEESKLDEAIKYTKELIDKLEPICVNTNLKPFDLLMKIEEEYIR